jgi:hypothetical protein
MHTYKPKFIPYFKQQFTAYVNNLYYNGRLVSWSSVSPTTAKLNYIMFCVRLNMQITDPSQLRNSYLRISTIIWGPQAGDYEEFYFLGHNAL